MYINIPWFDLKLPISYYEEGYNMSYNWSITLH